MSKNTLRIVAAIVDTQKMVVYKEDGSTITYLQGDPKIRLIINQSGPLSQGQPVVEIVFPEELIDQNHYKEFEKKSSGIVKFFRVAKQKLIDLFTDPVEPTEIGTSNLNKKAEPTQKASPPPIANAIEEIMRHAVPVAHDSFHEEGIVKQADVVVNHASAHTEADNDAKKAKAATHTIIGVVDNKVISGVERIKSQLERAAKTGSTKGVELFMQRIASVNRRHSADDLLKFMERGDLPIADDGCIVIYKVLKNHPSIKDSFVDCHTKNVIQTVGSYVCMDASLVDHNRSTECSNGLHVARRQYVSGFGGDVCVIAKVAPEDVIAVPTYDANKMRVCGYHILHKLSNDQYTKLKNNRPITDDEAGRKLLSSILAGDHIGKTQKVQITGNMGTKVVTTAYEADIVFSVKETQVPVEKDAPKPLGLALPDNSKDVAKDIPIDPKQVAKQVSSLVQATALSKREQALAIYARIAFGSTEQASVDAATELVALKKAAKKSWSNLGLTDQQGQDVVNVVAKAAE